MKLFNWLGHSGIGENLRDQGAKSDNYFSCNPMQTYETHVLQFSSNHSFSNLSFSLDAFVQSKPPNSMTQLECNNLEEGYAQSGKTFMQGP